MDLETAASNLKAADLKLLSRYQILIQTSFYPDAKLETFANLHLSSYFAQKLSIHLNAVVKSITGVTALNHTHQHRLIFQYIYGSMKTNTSYRAPFLARFKKGTLY